MRYFKGDAKLFIIEFPLYNIIEFRIILSTLLPYIIDFPDILSTSALLLSTKDKTTQTDIHLRHTRQHHIPKQKNQSHHKDQFFLNIITYHPPSFTIGSTDSTLKFVLAANVSISFCDGIGYRFWKVMKKLLKALENC